MLARAAWAAHVSVLAYVDYELGLRSIWPGDSQVSAQREAGTNNHVSNFQMSKISRIAGWRDLLF
jgi:hypothetical protein